MGNLTKADLISKISDKLSVSKKDVTPVADAFLEVLKESLLEENTVELRGFGTFEIKEVVLSNRRDPKTGKSVEVAPYKKVRFRPGKDLGKL